MGDLAHHAQYILNTNLRLHLLRYMEDLAHLIQFIPNIQ